MERECACCDRVHCSYYLLLLLLPTAKNCVLYSLQCLPIASGLSFHPSVSMLCISVFAYAVDS